MQWSSPALNPNYRVGRALSPAFLEYQHGSLTPTWGIYGVGSGDTLSPCCSHRRVPQKLGPAESPRTGAGTLGLGQVFPVLWSRRRDGGSSCVGPARSHRSCRTESCPDGARDFRAEQCAEFDGAEFQGRRYRWLPYYSAPNKCELNCIPKGENFYYKHREAVVDGTPCEPGKRDVCVDGSCRVVGCDHELDSSKQEDKCLRCGGDGTTCYPVAGTFDANDLSRGYNQILIVPVGATSILIEEAAASRNFLAVKNVRGEYYLNGHWTIEAAQALPAASTILHYERGAEGDLAPEQLHARGPTSEPLVIELISQEPNPGVHYEYHLPLRRPGPGFSWSHGSWSDCSAECGGGHQSRLVFCTIDHEAYPDHMCQRQPRPADRRSCNLHPCPETKRWKAGPWAPCSASCGGGSQSRSVYCISSDGAGIQEAVEEAECAGLPGKPPAIQACNLQRCAAWSPEPWGECSVSCGVGVRKRSVTCRGERGSLLHTAACSLEDRPPLTEPCVHEDCPLLSDQAWHVGTWGLCSKSCSSGTRRRQVVCAIGPPSHCGSLQHSKPVDVEPCNTQPCHLPQEVPSMQDVHTPASNPWMPLGPQESPASDSRGQWWAAQEHPSARGDHRGERGDPRGDQGTHLSALGPAPSLQQPPYQQPLWSGSGPHDCRHSPHGCCPDGHTASLGPQWQGCPGAPCQQSRSTTPTSPRPSRMSPVSAGAPSLAVAMTTWPQQPVLLGKAVWASPAMLEASGRSTHTDGGGSSPAGEQEPSQHSTGATVQRKPWPSGGLWRQDQQPGPGEAPHTQAFGEWPWGQELGSRAPGLGGDAGSPAPPFHSSSYRISLAGVEPSLVQAALGQLVRLSCSDDTAPESQAAWQKDGQPISSDRHRLQSDGSLIIHPLQAEDAGTYSCGSTRPGRDSQKIQLRIIGGDMAVLSEAELSRFPQPRDPAQDFGQAGAAGPLGAIPSSHPQPANRLRLDQNQPRVVDASPGQRIRMTCRAEGFPPPAIEWQRDGQPVSSPRHQLQPDGSLVISRVAVEDGGFYTCVAFNGQDRDQRWVQLRVLGELTISGLPPTVTVPEGDTARLLCVVAGESVNIRWSRNGLPVQADGHRVHQSPDGTLLIYNLRARDEGSYTCSAYRGSQAVSRSTEVKVVSPAPTAQPRDPGRDCVDQPELANCDLILQAQLCGNEYYSSFCCASCSRFQPHAQPIWQ
nr:papilin isoform X8 [Pan troglodytes]